MVHATKVLNVAESGDLSMAVQQSAFADRETLQDAFLFIVPERFRETATPILTKLEASDIATLLAYMAVTWHEGYNVGQGELVAAIREGGYQAEADFLQKIIQARKVPTPTS